MPEENPNRADELLKRYAKERRGKGARFELHPATRRLLHGEVARQFMKPGGRMATKIWERFWLGRFAVSGAVAAGLVACAWIFWPRENVTQLALLDAPPRLNAEAAPPAFTPSAVLEAAPEFSESGLATAQAPTLAGPEERDGYIRLKDTALSAATPPAPIAPVPQAPRPSLAPAQFGVSLAPNDYFEQRTAGATGGNVDAVGLSLEPLNRSQVQQRAGFFDYADIKGSSNQLAGASTSEPLVALKAQAAEKEFDVGSASAPLAVASRSRRLEAAITGAGGVAGAGPESLMPDLQRTEAAVASATVLQFQRVPEPVARSFFRFGKSPGEVAVLESFTIEQQSNGVRFIDRDGSVYDGVVENPPQRGLDERARQQAVAIREEESRNQQQRGALNFRATGSNVTLRQQVVVSGQLINVDQATNAFFAGATPAANYRQNAPMRAIAPTNEPGTVIEGTLQIGNSAAQRFRARQEQR